MCAAVVELGHVFEDHVDVVVEAEEGAAEF